MRTAFVTNFCPFYRVKLFQILRERIAARFLFFSDASEKNWEQLNPQHSSEFAVVALHSPPAGKWRVLWRLARHLWTTPYDIFIQGVSGKFAVLISYAIARLKRRPIILWTGFWNHPTTAFHRLTFPLVRYMYRHADALVGYGTHVRDYLRSLDVPSERIFIAYNTADNPRYNIPVPPEEIARLRAELGAGDALIALFVGRLEHAKGVDILLEALAALEPAQRPLLLINGRGPAQTTLQVVCKQHNLSSVRFLDYVPNETLYRYYAIADIVIVPSRTTKDFKEPWGLVVNEAMNQGCVVIASDAVGAARGGLLEDGVNGLIFPEGDAAALAQALRHVITDEPLRRWLSETARATIAGWTYERMAQGFIAAVDFVRAAGFEQVRQPLHNSH